MTTTIELPTGGMLGGVTLGGVVLCGGQSRRMGQPKMRLPFGDELMPLHHVARADDSSFERALEISILGQHASELDGWQLERRQM